MHRIVLPAAIILLLTGANAYASDTLSPQNKDRLASIEQKYFGHKFEGEETEARVLRIEQLIYGEAETGPLAGRLDKILQISADNVGEASGASTEQAGATLNSQTESKPPSNGSSTSSSSSNTPAVQPTLSQDEATTDSYPHITALETAILGRSFDSDSLGTRLGRLESKAFGKPSSSPDFSKRTDDLEAYAEKTLKMKPFAQAPDEDVYVVQAPDSGASSADHGDYPHVSALEKAILGKSFDGESVSDRLGRMETKIYGKVSASADLSTRTDDLEAYAEKNLHMKPFGAPADGSSASDSTASADCGSYPHITALEKNILGQTYASEPIAERLGRMETTAFGHASSDPDLSSRTDALETYSRKTLHKKSFEAQQASAQGATRGPGGGINKKQLLAMAANTLLGVAGLGGAGMGIPGAGMGLLNSMGSPAPTEEPSRPAEREVDEDPAVFAQQPPPAQARMITKVGWCEAQVFGTTFSNMHLTKRLRQLSDQLHLDTKKSDFQLMDDVDVMVKTVQSQFQKRPIGTAPQPVAQ
jgi:Tfp pilus assembly protein PilP